MEGDKLGETHLLIAPGKSHPEVVYREDEEGDSGCEHLLQFPAGQPCPGFPRELGVSSLEARGSLP